MGVVTQLPHAAAERARAKSFLVYIPAACLAPFCLTGVQVVFVVDISSSTCTHLAELRKMFTLCMEEQLRPAMRLAHEYSSIHEWLQWYSLYLFYTSTCSA